MHGRLTGRNTLEALTDPLERTGMLQSMSSLSFMFVEVGTPVWFLLLLFGVPTGETLRYFRTFVRRQMPSDEA